MWHTPNLNFHKTLIFDLQVVYLLTILFLPNLLTKIWPEKCEYIRQIKSMATHDVYIIYNLK